MSRLVRGGFSKKYVLAVSICFAFLVVYERATPGPEMAGTHFLHNPHEVWDILSQSRGRPKGDTVKGAALFCCQKFLKWEGVHASTAKVSKRSHNRCYGRADNHHQKSHPYSPPNRTGKTQTRGRAKAV